MSACSHGLGTDTGSEKNLTSLGFLESSRIMRYTRVLCTDHKLVVPSEWVHFRTSYYAAQFIGASQKKPELYLTEDTKRSQA